MRSFLTVIGAALLVLSYVTVSDARPHAKRTGSHAERGGLQSLGLRCLRATRDSSCFSRYYGTSRSVCMQLTRRLKRRTQPRL